jgi:GxxExxY protein
MNENQLTGKIIQCAIKVHSRLGPGLLESVYKECLYYELCNEGLRVEKEVPIPVVYKEVKLDCGYRVDLFVENQVVIELKAIDDLQDIHLAQTLTYLRMANKRFGLLINFNVEKLKHGIKRVINGY